MEFQKKFNLHLRELFTSTLSTCIYLYVFKTLLIFGLTKNVYL